MSREPSPKGLGPTGFDPARGMPPGFRPLGDFLAEQHAKGIARDGWLRWKWRMLKARVRVRWRLRLYYWRHPAALRRVSQEAFDAVSADRETLAAIAMEARSVETAGLHPKDDSAGPQDIAQPPPGDPQ